MNIEVLAKQAGFTVTNGSCGLKFSGGSMEKFAVLVAEAEREACAALCDAAAQERDYYATDIAKAIRERSNS